jgi:hypothetical protein
VGGRFGGRRGGRAFTQRLFLVAGVWFCHVAAF